MKTKSIIITMLALLFMLNSCDWFNNGSDKERIIINNNANDLSSRVEIKDEQMPLNGLDNTMLNKVATEDSSSFVLVLRAEVEAPVYNGLDLRASHVTIKDGYAYVTYNLEGEDYLGGIEVFDVNDISHPQLVSQAIITDTDISAIVYKDNALYLAEALNLNTNTDFSSPAILEKMVLQDGLLSANTSQLDLSSYVATDVSIGDEKIYVSTGSDGHLYVIDIESFAIDTSYALTDARSVDIDGDKVAVLSASPFSLSIFGQAKGNFINQYAVGGLTIPESKSEVELDGNYAYVALNDEGMKVIDITTGTIVDQMLRPETIPGGDDIDYVTNSVTINNELILLANGAAGVWLGSKYDDDSVEIYGSMSFQSSTNFVEAKDDVIFVATGFGGFRILEIQRYMPEEGQYLTLGEWDEDGLPLYLETEKDSLDDSLLNDIHDALPWTESAPDHSPEFFNNVETNLVMTEDASLYVTYIYESAGFKNSLGFYTYDPFNPPTSPDEIDDMTIVFPNTSRLGSGGSLEKGHTVCLGDFTSGTGVGFFLVSNGWNNGEVTEGLYTHYTHFDFNPELDENIRQHTVLLKDDERDVLIMGFEDVSRKYASCDQDFDDTVFLIKSTPKNAYVSNNIPDLEKSVVNFVYKEKNTIFDMSIAEGWRPWVARGYSQDNTVYVSGSSSAKITVNSVESAARLTMEPKDFSHKVIRVRFKADNWEALTRFDLRFYTNVELTSGYILNFRAYFAKPNNGEWYDIVFPRSAFEAIGDSPDWSTVRDIYIRANSNEDTEVHIDEIELYRARLPEGLVTISFDDGFDETYTEGALYMEKYNLSGTAFVMPDQIDTPGFLTEAQLDSLHNLGWGISGHHINNLRKLTLSEVETEISEVKAWLVARDYNGIDHFAYPNGSYNKAVQEIVLEHFSTARTIDGFNQPLEHIVPSNVNSRTIGHRIPIETLKAQIVDAIENNEWLILNFHKLVESACDDVEYDICSFRELIDFLYNSGITVMPYHEVIEEYGQ